MEETKTKFWSGLNTIGSNIVSFEYGNYRIITDFGALSTIKIEELGNRENLVELLEAGKLPAIDGIYDKDELREFPLLSNQDDARETIILISHLHLDHVGSLGHLSYDIPVYALEAAVDFYQDLEKNHLLPSYPVSWRKVIADQDFTFGPFTLRFVEVDHDTVGSASIFIESPDLKVIHSGDWRLTGFRPEKVLDWGLKARAFTADLLLMEGTSFSFVDRAPSEADRRIEAITKRLTGTKTEFNLLDKVEGLVDQAKDQLVAFNLYPQNLDRLKAFVHLMNQKGRTLILDDRYYAFVAHRVEDTRGIESLSKVNLETVKVHPSQYALQVDFENMEHLMNLPSGLYIHSNGMPIGSYDPQFEPFVNKIVKAGWTFYHAGCFGHADMDSLLLLNRVIDPEYVVPWHSFRPEAYAQAIQEQGQRTWLPEVGILYGLNAWKEQGNPDEKA